MVYEYHVMHSGPVSAEKLQRECFLNASNLNNATAVRVFYQIQLGYDPALLVGGKLIFHVFENYETYPIEPGVVQKLYPMEFTPENFRAGGGTVYGSVDCIPLIATQLGVLIEPDLLEGAPQGSQVLLQLYSLVVKNDSPVATVSNPVKR